VVSSPSGALVHRTWWYTALGLAAFFLSPTPAEARYILQDDTPPAVSYSIDGTAGNNGWYVRSASGPFIVVHWSVSGSITSTTGCEPAIRVNDPNTGTTLTCTASGPGGTTSVTTKLLKVDGTAPSTSVAPSRTPNGSGWYRAPVSLQWSGSDTTSGIASCSQQTYSGPDAASTSQTGSCTDNAGNSSNASLTLHYDSTPPSTTAASSPAPNANGWLKSGVQVTWNGADALSGLASCDPKSTYSGPDTAASTLSGSCTDIAGNSSSAAFVVRMDTAAPTTTAVPARAPNAAGWYRAPIAVSGSGTDSLSGVDSCTSTTYSGPDTSGVSRSVTCTDKAGNSSSGSSLVKYDATPPDTAAAPARAPNGAGWFNAPVAIAGSATDALSGVDSCTSTTYSGPDTTGTSRSVACTDLAGNSSSDAYLVKYDASPPSVTGATIGRVPDASGWYNHAVRLDWHGTDATSGIASCSSLMYAGPDGANATAHGSCTDSAGNSASLDFGLQYDATPPTVAVNPARPADHDGWYTRPVSISWSGTDATSGIDTCSAPLMYSGPDNGNASSTGGCTDRAGNSAAPPPLSFRYDATPPTVQAGATRPPDANGWYDHGLRVDWSGTDPISGIASCTSFAYSGPDAASVQPSGACADKAGNTSPPVAFGFRFDATPPTGVAVAPERPPDHGGWYNRPFAVRWSGSDALSGIASCATATYGGPANGATALTGSCTDQAGNTSGSVGYSFKYDATPPAFHGLSLTPLDKIVTARWRTSGASGFKVTRKPGLGTAASSVVYDGPASSFADRRVENYVRYTYLVMAEDVAGNELARTAAATPMPVLFAPRPGTRVGAGTSPLFAWRPARKATYYNLQLWLRGNAVGSWWPARPRLKLSSRWRFGGSPHTLEQGSYTWYVWPGRGSRRLGKYGPLLGKSTFVVGT